MRLEGVIMVKKEEEVTSGRGASIRKGLVTQEMWQEIRL